MYYLKFNNNELNNELNNESELSVEKLGNNSYKISLKEGKFLKGSYNIRIEAGDKDDEGDVTLNVKINNQKMPGLWINDKSINSIDYKVDLENDSFVIEFSGKYVCIQGITINKIKDETIEKIEYKIINENNLLKVKILIKGNAKKYKIVKRLHNSLNEEECILTKEKEYIDEAVKLGKKYDYRVIITDEGEFDNMQSEVTTIEIKDENKPKIEIQEFFLNEVSIEKDNKYVELCISNHEDILEYQLYKKYEFSDFKLIRNIKPVDITRDDHIKIIDKDVYLDTTFTYGLVAASLGGTSNMKTVLIKERLEKRKRQMEKLDRGLVAIKTSEGVFLSWRLCAYEYEKEACFNIYADNILIHTTTKKDPTNYIHKEGCLETSYTVNIIVDGIEEDSKKSIKPLANNYFDIPINKPQPFRAPNGDVYEYTANDAAVADLDGDGEYEIILKWDCNGKDNSHKGITGIVYLDAYKLDGRMLWRIDLGINIRCGAHYTQFLVYDFDGDGKAEMMCKTADGTKDSAGGVIGDETKDYRNAEGFIIEGPEYLTLFDGETGKILDTTEYDPPRGDVKKWGDSWGNRVDRFLAAVAYLDGEKPSAIMCRGYYDHKRPTVLAAYDIKNKKIVKRWTFVADDKQNIEYTNQGFHNLSVGDVDGDGCDEIVYGACVIDHDGTGLYSTGLEHGDAMHLGGFHPDSKKLCYYGIHEHSSSPYGLEVHEAGTGKVTFGKFTGIDTGRGLCAKIDPRYRGNQIWAYDGAGLYNIDGTFISNKSPLSINFAIWWDGDLLRELLDHEWMGYETGIGIPKIDKWDYEKEELVTILKTNGVLSNNGTKGNPCIQASILGDWREEAVFRLKDSSALRVYMTTDYTKHRFYTFMHDYVYRLGIAWQNVAYNQPPHTSFYIGDEMKEIPIPNNYYN